MKEDRIQFAPLNISPLVWFRGTEAEQEEAEAKESNRAKDLEKIIFTPSFIAAEYTNGNGQRRILHRSTRPGVKYQLSFIDADGVPAMHENYISEGGNPQEVGTIHSASELIQHFINQSNNSPLNLHIITA